MQFGQSILQAFQPTQHVPALTSWVEAHKAKSEIIRRTGYDPFSKTTVTDQGGTVYGKTPPGVPSGKMNVPMGLPEYKSVSITIDSTKETTAHQIVLGSGADFYRVLTGTSWTANPPGMVYSGPSPNSDLYEQVLKEFDTTTQVFSMVTIRTMATTDHPQSETNAKQQLMDEWKLFRGNIERRYSAKPIVPEYAQNPFQNNEMVIALPLLEDEARIDNQTCWIAEHFRPFIRMELRFYLQSLHPGRV